MKKLLAETRPHAEIIRPVVAGFRSDSCQLDAKRPVRVIQKNRSIREITQCLQVYAGVAVG